VDEFGTYHTCTGSRDIPVTSNLCRYSCRRHRFWRLGYSTDHYRGTATHSGSMLSLLLKSKAAPRQELESHWGSLAMSVIAVSIKNASLTALRILSDSLRCKGSDGDNAHPRERRLRHGGVLQNLLKARGR
jgi:hypothetical protein